MLKWLNPYDLLNTVCILWELNLQNEKNNYPGSAFRILIMLKKQRELNWQ